MFDPFPRGSARTAGKNSKVFHKVDFWKNWKILNIFQKFQIVDPLPLTGRRRPRVKNSNFFSKSWFLTKLENFEHFSEIPNFLTSPPPRAGAGRG